MTKIKFFNQIICVGDTAIEELGKLNTSAYSKIFCLVDENTEKHCISVFRKYFKLDFNCICIKSGEENKTLETCTEIWNELLAQGANRNSLLINLGGGVVSDIGGFVAANFKRGIQFVNVPTTLLSMVDAALGGKTGVNLKSVKNQIGSFTFPEAVFIIPEFLKSLEKDELKQGYAEILKHALIADSSLWDKLKTNRSDNIVDDDILTNAIKIKLNVVEKDPKEKGERKLLNFGHTVGHAVESWSYNSKGKKLSHGEAIAIGIIAESFMSYRNSFISFEKLMEICDTVYLYFSPVYIEEENMDEIIGLMVHDKKNDNYKINITLLKEIGTAIINQYAEPELLKESLEFYKNFPDRNYIAEK